MAINLKTILHRATDTNLVSSSGPILDYCRELASDGKFEAIGASLEVWFSKFPHSTGFVRSRLPAIILNSYLITKCTLTFQAFLDWEVENKDWCVEISIAASDPIELPKVVANIEANMHKYVSSRA